MSAQSELQITQIEVAQPDGWPSQDEALDNEASLLAGCYALLLSSIRRNRVIRSGHVIPVEPNPSKTTQRSVAQHVEYVHDPSTTGSDDLVCEEHISNESQIEQPAVANSCEEELTPLYIGALRP